MVGRRFRCVCIENRQIGLCVIYVEWLEGVFMRKTHHLYDKNRLAGSLKGFDKTRFSTQKRENTCIYLSK